MKRVVMGEGEQRSPARGAPTAGVLLDGKDGGVALLAVTVPAGGRMPPHDHGASSVVLVPLAGEVELSGEDGEGSVGLSAGTAGTVGIGRRVQIANTGEGEAKLLVVLSPPDFVEAVQAWPLVEAGQ